MIFYCCVTKGPWALEESGRSQQGQPSTWDVHMPWGGALGKKDVLEAAGVEESKGGAIL